MPLARLSIKSAIRVARSHVTCERCGGTGWKISARFPDGSSAPGIFESTAERARARTRMMRIFVALLALGVESTEALPVATADERESQQRPWRDVVAAHMERRALTTPKGT